MALRSNPESPQPRSTRSALQSVLALGILSAAAISVGRAACNLIETRNSQEEVRDIKDRLDDKGGEIYNLNQQMPESVLTRLGEERSSLKFKMNRLLSEINDLDDRIEEIKAWNKGVEFEGEEAELNQALGRLQQELVALEDEKKVLLQESQMLMEGREKQEYLERVQTSETSQKIVEASNAIENYKSSHGHSKFEGREAEINQLLGKRTEEMRDKSEKLKQVSGAWEAYNAIIEGLNKMDKDKWRQNLEERKKPLLEAVDELVERAKPFEAALTFNGTPYFFDPVSRHVPNANLGLDLFERSMDESYSGSINETDYEDQPSVGADEYLDTFTSSAGDLMRNEDEGATEIRTDGVDENTNSTDTMEDSTEEVYMPDQDLVEIVDFFTRIFDELQRSPHFPEEGRREWKKVIEELYSYSDWLGKINDNLLDLNEEDPEYLKKEKELISEKKKLMVSIKSYINIILNSLSINSEMADVKRFNELIGKFGFEKKEHPVTAVVKIEYEYVIKEEKSK